MWRILSKAFRPTSMGFTHPIRPKCEKQIEQSCLTYVYGFSLFGSANVTYRAKFPGLFGKAKVWGVLSSSGLCPWISSTSSGRIMTCTEQGFLLYVHGFLLYVHGFLLSGKATMWRIFRTAFWSMSMDFSHLERPTCNVYWTELSGQILWCISNKTFRSDFMDFLPHEQNRLWRILSKAFW